VTRKYAQEYRDVRRDLDKLRYWHVCITHAERVHHFRPFSTQTEAMAAVDDGCGLLIYSLASLHSRVPSISSSAPPASSDSTPPFSSTRTHRSVSSVAINTEAGYAEVELTQGRWAKFSIEDLDLVLGYTWQCSDSRGKEYAVGSSGSAHVKLHREIMGLSRGDPRQVDHINGDCLDNCRQNLRIVTAEQNHQNRGKNRKSVYKGVHKRRDGRYQAVLMASYDTAEEAARAYDRMALAVLGEDAYLNNVDQVS
jgi:hypothetical protein